MKTGLDPIDFYVFFFSDTNTVIYRITEFWKYFEKKKTAKKILKINYYG